jgi:hypothetical protein
MCVMCAAIPMAVSLGAAATAKHQAKRHDQEALGEAVPHSHFSPARLTTVIVAGLVVGSVVYHTVVLPNLGI